MTGNGPNTEAKQSLLSIDDLTLSQTDGTALKQPKHSAPMTTSHQAQTGAAHHYSSIGQLLQGSLLTNENMTATVASKEHLEEVKRVFQLMQQMQQECKIAETQRDRAIEELNTAKHRWEQEQLQNEELWQAKMRAKEYEVAELRDLLADN